MNDKGVLVITGTIQDGDGRIYGHLALARKVPSGLFGERVELEPVGILDIGAGRAFTFLGEPLGENRNQAMIDGVVRIVTAGGWPGRGGESEPLAALEGSTDGAWLPVWEEKENDE